MSEADLPPADHHLRIAALEHAVAARDGFIAAIGHELRNPMVPIVLTAERLRELAEAGDLARIRRSVEILVKATDAFTRRTTQLLDLSRMASGNFTLVCERVDISACVQDTAERHGDIARRAGCDFSVEVAAGIAGMADRAGLEQLLDNLLSNAFKYGAGRPVALRLSEAAGEARIAVQDHGAGIAAEEQGRIFGLFERARDPGAPGLGIGLWIAGSVARAMGGRIDVASRPGEGALFTLHFPLSGPPQPA